MTHDCWSYCLRIRNSTGLHTFRSSSSTYCSSCGTWLNFIQLNRFMAPHSPPRNLSPSHSLWLPFCTAQLRFSVRHLPETTHEAEPFWGNFWPSTFFWFGGSFTIWGSVVFWGKFPIFSIFFGDGFCTGTATWFR